jgi:uncharacterized membrane protein YfcA
MAMAAVLTLIAVAVGAVVQGSIGFGYAFVAVPTMALLYPEALPVTPLLLALPMTALMTAREWHSIDITGFLLITVARLAGTVAGVTLLVLVPASYLSVIVGLLITAVALLSFFSPNFEVSNKTRIAGGMASGITSTTAAIGGPPLALIYQDRSGAELRSTLSISFVVGTVMSLAALAFAGKVQGWHFLLALQLLPGLLVGLWSSRWVIRYLDERWLRPAVLMFAAVAGFTVTFLGPQG